MKKLVIALTALAAFTGSALAADLAPRPYAKAPMPMPVAEWPEVRAGATIALRSAAFGSGDETVIVTVSSAEVANLIIRMVN